MIPQAYIQAWREHAPWPNLAQVEQDLIICRALCDLFNAPALAGKIAFRGGTAIHKLLFKQPLRYSEDIDLVQTQAEPIGATVDAIRDALSWLGKCQREQAGHSMHLVFRFAPESAPQTGRPVHRTTWRLCRDHGLPASTCRPRRAYKTCFGTLPTTWPAPKPSPRKQQRRSSRAARCWC